MISTLTPILALARSENHESSVAVLQRALRIILPLNRPARTVQAVNSKAATASRDWQTPFTDAAVITQPVVSQSVRSLAVRPPPRWGINE